MIPKNCASCVIYGYHANLSKRIESNRQRRWGETLTKICNSCNNFSNWHDQTKYKLNDVFVEKLVIKVRSGEVNVRGKVKENEIQELAEKPNLPLKTIRRFIKEAGASRVSADAVRFLGRLMEDYGKQLTGEALLFMEHAGRTTLLAKDFELTQKEGVYSELLSRIRCQKCIRGQNKNE